MKKIILGLLAAVFIAGNALATEVCFELTTAKAQRIVTGFVTRYPNTECETYDEGGLNCIKLKYTDAQWVKERVRRFIRNAFKAGEQMIEKNNAYSAMPDDHDESIVIVP